MKTEELELEIKAREELIKRLEHPLKLLKTAALKEKDKRKAKVAKFAQYDRYEDALELYGYDVITYEELKEVEEYFENGADFIENEVSPVEYAERMLKQFTTNLHSEVRSFKFDLLPPEAQARILEEQERRRKENNNG